MNRRRAVKISQIFVVLLLFGLATWLIGHYGVSQLRTQVERLGIWVPLGIFSLRFTSVLIPALPGTTYSVLAGSLLGFPQGLLVICIADLSSCSLSFSLSRRYGRTLVQRIVGKRFIHRVDTLSRKHLERNFFLMTGCLMTGFFDFVCYAVGLTKAPLQRFAPALVISIAISNPPIVAFGAGLLEGGKALLGIGLLGMFGLAIVTGWAQRARITPS